VVVFYEDEEDTLFHYGTPRHSGRYPWGSGGEEGGPQHNRNFLDHVAELRRQGLSEAEIARGVNMTTTQLRAQKAIEKNRLKQDQVNMAWRLKEKGMSNIAIGQRMNLNESTVRSLLAPGEQNKLDTLHITADMLKAQVEKKGLVDIGTGVENHIGVSQTKLNTAVAMLQSQGYKVHYVKIEQLGTGQNTTLKVLSKDDVTYSDVFKNRDKIQQVTDFSDDGGRTFDSVQPPLSISSKRVGIRYAEQGGADADGVIYVRPGVDDVSLGASRYAQVRIAVDGTHYLKGMAMYKEDLPDGVDLVFNTNKSDTGKKTDAMKALKDDPENPFGSVVRQQMKNGKVSSSMNIVNEEGDWEGWSKNLSSQMLSKQSSSLAKTQLNLTVKSKQDELAEIMSLSNPAVRRKLLESFADDADSSAVHLKAAALPRQRSQVILPINSLSNREIYAPNFRNGESVVLVRYPHGGIFEIPELRVNNNHPEAKKLLGDAKDAVGINAKVAERLSGADFDGDTVLVIPNGKRQVKTSPALEGLKGFDPKASYPAYEGMPPMSPETKAFKMGEVSNLITDMTIRGATHAELARAVRHSMVVIDAEKHNLNYKQSALDNGIRQLKAKYQAGTKNGGASTLISRASSEVRVNERKQGYRIDPDTGNKIYTETGNSYVNKEGKLVVLKTRTTKLAETSDAATLSSGTTIEQVYVDHSNSLKALANEARKNLVATKSIPYSPSAKVAYAREVTSLNAKLNVALRNRPLERQAQIIGNGAVAAKRRANPGMDNAELKKLKAQELMRARARVNPNGKPKIELTDSEWAAIQAGAISNNKLSQILNNADLDQVKQLATPKTKILMTPTKTAKAAALLKSGYTQAEVADALGVSLSTLKTSIGGTG
jgi:DNA-binding CsgD family transcriptional regulator